MSWLFCFLVITLDKSYTWAERWSNSVNDNDNNNDNEKKSNSSNNNNKMLPAISTAFEAFIACIKHSQVRVCRNLNIFQLTDKFNVDFM